MDTYDLLRKPKAYLRAKGGDPLRSLRHYKCPPTTYSPLSEQGEVFTPRIQGYMLAGSNTAGASKCQRIHSTFVLVLERIDSALVFGVFAVCKHNNHVTKN